jgi:hypothetical protein
VRHAERGVALYRTVYVLLDARPGPGRIAWCMISPTIGEEAAEAICS